MLTGGSKDVNPQFFHLAQNTSAANTYTETAFVIPVQRISPQRSTEAIVMEVLKIFFNIPELDTTNAAETYYTARAAISTSSLTVMPALNNPKALMMVERSAHKAFTAAGTYETPYTDPLVIDLTDGAGHGILVATDNLYFQTTTVNYGAAAGFAAKVLYRWKTVGLTEYIGIVQSQQ